MIMRSTWIVLTLGLLLVACSDDGGGAPDAAPEIDGPPATFYHDQDIQPVWDVNCVQCHANFMDGYEAMVRVQTGQADMNRIEPGDLDNSYVWRKLNDTHRDVGGTGNPMPPAPFGALGDEDLGMIETWILEGAPR